MKTKQVIAKLNEVFEEADKVVRSSLVALVANMPVNTQSRIPLILLWGNSTKDKAYLKALYKVSDDETFAEFKKNMYTDAAGVLCRIKQAAGYKQPEGIDTELMEIPTPADRTHTLLMKVMQRAAQQPYMVVSSPSRNICVVTFRGQKVLTIALSNISAVNNSRIRLRLNVKGAGRMKDSASELKLTLKSARSILETLVSRLLTKY